MLLAAQALAGSALGQESLTIPTEDEGRVAALMYGSGEAAVLLVPGGRFDKHSWDRQASVLGAAGFRVLAIELRGRGDSLAGNAGPDALQLDVLPALRYLRESGATRIAVIGASIGGWAAAEAVSGAAAGEVDRLVLLAHSGIDHPERLTGRKLFVVARDDARAEGTIPRLPAVEAQYRRAPPPKRLLLLDGSAHAQLLFDSDQGQRLMDEILEFLTVP